MDWKKATSKEIYEKLIKTKIQRPMILENNPNLDYSTLFKNIANKTLSAKSREHLYKQSHNVLPTNVRLRICGFRKNDKCDFCNEKDDAITSCGVPFHNHL